MSLTMSGLLLVTTGAIVLALWVFAPRNKSYFEQMAAIPLSDADPGSEQTDSQIEQGSTRV